MAICANLIAFEIFASFSSEQAIWIPASLIKVNLSYPINVQNANKVGGTVSTLFWVTKAISKVERFISRNNPICLQSYPTSFVYERRYFLTIPEKGKI